MIAASAVLLAVALVASSAAAAGTPFTAGAGVNPRIALTPDGTGHLVWSIPVRGVDGAAVGYCRLPPGATACDRTQVLLFPSNRGLAKSGGDVTVQAQSDATLLITSACYGCAVGDAQEGIQRWRSADGGASFTAEPGLGGTPTNAGMGPDGITVGAGVYVTPADGDQIIARPGTPDTTTVDAATGTQFVHTPSIVQVPGQTRLVYAVSDLFAIRTAIFNGPDFAATTLMDPARWAADATLPSAESGVRDPRLTAGPSGVWLSYEQKVPLDDHVLVRRFDAAKSTFGAPRSLESGDETDAVVDDTSSAQDGAGRLHVVWRTDLDQKLLRYTRSDAGGGRFAAPATIAQGESFMNPEAGAGPDGAGWVVWQARGDSPIRALRIDASSLGGATGPPVGPSAASGTTTRSVSVPGATISLRFPSGCVRRGTAFRATLTWKRRKKKGNVFVKVTRADFYIGVRRVKIDRGPPFRQTLRVPAGARRGSTVTLRARAFIKVRKGKAPKKSIRAAIRVCP